MAKTTWRFEFVDVNKSITVNEGTEDWTGYMVVRAPKGQTSAMYIPPNNQQMIEAMFGYASADWPDLYEAIDFNNEYGLYISAPTIDMSEYPNYYGGVYLTSVGVVPMYKVTDKKAPNYEVGIVPSTESITLPDVKDSKISLRNLNDPGVQAVIEITGVDSDVFKRLTYIDFKWTDKITVRYQVNKTTNTLVATRSDNGAEVICGTFAIDADTGLYNFVIGGDINDQLTTVSALNTTDDENGGIPFIDFNSTTYKSDSAYHYSNYMGTATTIDEWKANDTTGLPDQILDAIVNSGTVTYLDKKLTYDTSLKNCFHLVYDVEDETYAYIIQPSITGIQTTITLSDIVYDKYVYSMKLYYSTTNTGADGLPSLESDAELFNKTLTDNGYLVLGKNDNGELRVYENVEEEDEDTEVTTRSWKDVTSEYITETILAYEPLTSKDKDTDVHHKIFYVSENGLTAQTTDATDDEYKLQENVLYNSFHCKATEEDSEGEIHVSGDFTGSLDEFGTDENGSEIYWEELIPPDDSVVYAEVYVVKTFDDDLDDNGIYTGYREESDSSTIVSGQRYVDYVVNQNIKNGNTGGNVTDAKTAIQKKFAKIVREGLIEAAKPKYEDCSIFMECTGLDTIKTYLGSIRTSHYTSTIITPKNITEALFNNCKTITVSGRYRGTAQFLQELQYKDKNLHKKYYACPIGAVGVMLMRIMEGYLGGVAPAWLNDGDVGGQLDDILQRSPVKARWDFEDADTKVLDTKGINPILMDIDDGVMIVSQRTTEQNAGDWSYLGHSMAFDLCKREIRDNVMKPQLMKKISPHWISVRQSQVDRILAKRTEGDDPIWSYASSDIASVNNNYTRAQRVFNIPVEVRVYPFSEKVRLVFTNLSQITTVSD